jgi:crotonobetainyl-CoA:carnitine CoA-transferase CaiB-like acyl-CoA transferase
VLEEPQTKASGMILAAPHPRVPDYRAVGLPIRWDRQRPGLRSVPPLVGEQSVDVLTWLGYTIDEVRSLKSKGVVE